MTILGWIAAWIISALVILLVAYISPGVKIANFFSALVVVVVLGLVNAFIRPFLIFITLPINILTLGLFTLVINALLILLVSAITPGFKVNSFWDALLFGIILAVVNWIVFAIIP